MACARFARCYKAVARGSGPEPRPPIAHWHTALQEIGLSSAPASPQGVQSLGGPERRGAEGRRGERV